MVAIYVVSLIILFVVIDLIRSSIQHKIYRRRLKDITEVFGFFVPPNILHSENHLWFKVMSSGEVRVGIDEFLNKLLQPIDAVILPENGKTLKTGDTMFSTKHGGKILHYASPVEGVITEVNTRVVNDTELIHRSCYNNGWLLSMKLANIPSNHRVLKKMRLNEKVSEWFGSELSRFRDFINRASEINTHLSDLIKKEGIIKLTFLKTTDDTMFLSFEKEFLSRIQ